MVDDRHLENNDKTPFYRSTHHMTCFCIRKCLLKFALILHSFWGSIAPIPPFLGGNRPFQAKRAKYSNFRTIKTTAAIPTKFYTMTTSGSAMAEGTRDALVSRNSATTKYRYRVALFA